MILTYKVKHERNFTEELIKAHSVANQVLVQKTFSSKDVKHIGLKSMIANQILRKYGRNKKIKSIHKVNLTIPNQGIKVDKKKQEIQVPCLKLLLHYYFEHDFEKINQIEIDKKYAYISITVKEAEPLKATKWIGVDLNTTGHVAVIANPETGKIKKLGKKAEHVHKKYKNIRKRLQKAGKYRLVKKIKSRESRIIRDINHKLSRKIVEEAKQIEGGIKLEKLKGIRKTAKSRRAFRYSLNSWSFYQLQMMIEYKAKLLGVPVEYVDPAYTSKQCSRCGVIGNRTEKKFKCPECGHVDHADSNAAFNIAMRPCIDQFVVDRDATKGSTDTPRAAIMITPLTAKPFIL